jgi:hypothetical protein
LRRWLLSGDCQSEAGAFCAWRDAKTGQLAFEYPEINGYLLTFAASLDDLEAHEIDAARLAADWLAERLARGDLSARASWDGGAIYTFDLAMIAAGLISFGRRFGAKYLHAGERLVDFLAAEIDSAGRLPAVGRGPWASHTGWASEGRAHLLKTVQCFLLVSAEVGSSQAMIPLALVEEAEQLQQPDGRFVTQPRADLTMLHPHLYALEGLWIWGTACSHGWALDRARLGLEWVFDQQLPSGGFPRFVRIGADLPGPEQADVTAQAIRLACLLRASLPGLDRAVERLSGLTVGDQHSCAAVYQPGHGNVHQNVWVSLFAAQALTATARPHLEWGGLV